MKLKRSPIKRVLTPAQRAILDAVKETCFWEHCEQKGVHKVECITCEAAGKAHVVFACVLHHPDALTAVKRHAVVKHPVNLLRVVAAGLRGDDIE